MVGALQGGHDAELAANEQASDLVLLRTSAKGFEGLVGLRVGREHDRARAEAATVCAGLPSGLWTMRRAVQLDRRILGPFVQAEAGLLRGAPSS